MKIKRYVGDTIQDTIFKVKADLGSDAIILNTRKFKEKGFLGLFGNKKVEVMAALEDESKNQIQQKKTLEEINELKQMISALEKNWQTQNQKVNFEGELSQLYDYLLAQGVKEKLAREMLLKIQEKDSELNAALYTQAQRELMNRLGHSAPIELNQSCQVVSFIGPTGVGKTTTIAKLAAKFSLEEQIDVGLITADTYRIAAVQQLETYSDIMNIPLEVVYNDKELNHLIKEKKEDYDLILFDTAGSSWNDQIQLGRLQGFTENELIDETHLLLSLNTKSQDQAQIIDHFSQLKPDKLLLTKLDETNTYGDILNLSQEYDYPYSYVTFGQDVPDDIQVAARKELSQYLLGGFNE